MKKIPVLLIVLLTTTVMLPASALAYRYMSPQEVKESLTDNDAMTLIDIQVEDEFSSHHIKGAVATYAYPVKSEAERTRLDNAIDTLKKNQDKAIVVCPRGGGGAKRAYDYMLDSGIPEERLYILTKGQAGWPYEELLAPAE